MEKQYIGRFEPLLNGSRVKQYSLGLPQLKIDISKTPEEPKYLYFRGDCKRYEDIADCVGVFPCTSEDEQYVAIEQKHVLRLSNAEVLAIRYEIDGISKTTKILSSPNRRLTSFDQLLSHPYRGGRIVSVRVPLKAYFS